MNHVKVLMNLLKSGLKVLEYARHMISDFFFTNNKDGQGYAGLENLGKTCYCNSVVQALYFCAPFRNNLLQYYVNGGNDKAKNNLLNCLADLFHHLKSKKSSHISPRQFVELVMEENEIFSGCETHQDAHEFLIFLLGNLDEEIKKWNNKQHPSRHEEEAEGAICGIREIFGGTFTNETLCSCCETVTCREEPFMDLSLEIQENSSLSNCLKAFSAVKKLSGENKYWCDKCCHFQEAEKRLRIKSPPNVLVCQLKRFKYTQNRFKKLLYRVAFPMEMRLAVNSRGDEDAADSLYSLFAVVVHVGRTVNDGHYIALVKNSSGQWLKIDDEKVTKIEESEVQDCFGSSKAATSNLDCKNLNAYVMFYQTVNDIEQVFVLVGES